MPCGQTGSTMRTDLKKTLTATMLIAVAAGLGLGLLAGAATANRAPDEWRVAGLGADTYPVASAPEEAVLVDSEATPGPAVLCGSDLARVLGDKSAAMSVAGDPVTRAPVNQRARGPPPA